MFGDSAFRLQRAAQYVRAANANRGVALAEVKVAKWEEERDKEAKRALRAKRAAQKKVRDGSAPNAKGRRLVSELGKRPPPWPMPGL